jgi:serine phosphatase RsbU (regulator of sigma subunit)
MATEAPALAKKPTLLIETAGQRRKVPVSKTPFTLGRSDQCDLVISDLRVSRQHAKVIEENANYIIVDAGSRHGTFVNGAREERATLHHNDTIALGTAGASITFLMGEAITDATNVSLDRLVATSDSSDLEKLRLFLEAARSLSGGLVVNDVLRNMVQYALKLTKAERGFVYLKSENGMPRLACGLDSTGAVLTQDTNVSQSVIHDSMHSASEFITGDATEQSALAARHSIVSNDLRTIIAIPLRSQRGPAAAMSKRQVDGVLYMDSCFVSRDISHTSHEVLRALANECAAVLESAKLVAAEQSAQHYRQEMEIAAVIQRSLVSVADVQSDFVRVAGRSIPCREIGGDFFDVHVSDDAVAVVVADVSGKGASAALLASVIHGMFYAQMSSGASLVDAVGVINGFLCSRVAGQKYATMLAVRVHRSGTVQIVNCGHVPALVMQDGVATQIQEGDLPVGLIPDACFHSVERQFPVGSRLCIITDGITETENEQGAEFGTGTIAECLAMEDPVRQVLAAIQSFAGNQEAADDRTMVVIERTR